MHDLWPVHSQRLEKIGLHLLLVHSHEKIGIIDIPEDLKSLRLEIRDKDLRVFDRVVEIAIASVVNTNGPCSRLVREDFDDRVLWLVLANDRVVLDQVVLEFASLIDEEQEITR